MEQNGNVLGRLGKIVVKMMVWHFPRECTGLEQIGDEVQGQLVNA